MDLPLVPVTATNGRGSSRHPSSASSRTSNPRANAARMIGNEGARPGLLIRVRGRGDRSSNATQSPPVVAIPRRASCSRAVRSLGRSSPSQARTESAPATSDKAIAAAEPACPTPATTYGPGGIGGRLVDDPSRRYAPSGEMRPPADESATGARPTKVRSSSEMSTVDASATVAQDRATVAQDRAIAACAAKVELLTHPSATGSSRFPRASPSKRGSTVMMNFDKIAPIFFLRKWMRKYSRACRKVNEATQLLTRARSTRPRQRGQPERLTIITEAQGNEAGC